MYNRYIPQPDGSYRRNRMDEPRQTPHNPPQRRPEPQRKAETPCPAPPPPQPTSECKPTIKEPPKHQNQQVPSFLRQLLPKDFDTGDLIIVLLLLLLAGDCEEDKSTALLTLVLYLFM